MTGTGGAKGDRGAIMVALILLVAMAGVEFGLYRPNQARLRTSEQKLQDVQAQIAAASRRRMTDEEILRVFDTDADGAAFRSVYQDKDGLSYLNELISGARLSRLDFKSEESAQDGVFRVERFYVTLQGTYERIFEFARAVESGKRLAMLDNFRIDPIENSTQAFLKVRVSIYGLPSETGSNP